MDELDELLSQAIDAGASDEYLQEITRLYYARTGVKKKEPSRPYSGVGSLDYSPNAPVNPLVEGVASAKQKASQPPVDKQPVKPNEFDIQEPQQKGMYESLDFAKKEAMSKVKQGFEQDLPQLRVNKLAEYKTQVEQYHLNSPKRVDSVDSNNKLLYYDAVVRDRIDLLFNLGKQDEANQLKETYEELLSEKSTGDLSRGQSEKLGRLIAESQNTLNAFKARELILLDNEYDVKGFFKANGDRFTEINSLAQRLSDPNIDQATKNALSAQLNALQDLVSSEMKSRGMTNEIVDQYAKISSTLVDPMSAYTDNVDKQFLDRSKEEAESQAMKRDYAQRVDDTNNFPLMVAETAYRGVGSFTETVVNSVLSTVGQAPKVIGDLLGDTDYDWADELYDKSAGLKQYASGALGWGDQDAEMPAYIDLARIFGNAAGSMATMMGGGAIGKMVSATKAAERTGSFATTMLMQMSDNYEGALAEGMDQQDAALFGTWSSVLSAAIEQVATEGVPPMNMTRLRDAIKNGVRGKELMDVAKTSMNEYLTNISKETGEEWLEASVGDLNKSLAGFSPENLFSAKEYTEAGIGALMLGGAMTAFRGPRKNPQMIAEAMYDMASVPSDQLPTMNKENAKAYTEMSNLLRGLEMLPNWNTMDREQRVIAFDKAREIYDLEQAQKITGVDQTEKLDELQTQLNEIVGQPTQTEQKDDSTEIGLQDAGAGENVAEVVGQDSSAGGGIVDAGGDGDMVGVREQVVSESLIETQDQAGADTGTRLPNRLLQDVDPEVGSILYGDTPAGASDTSGAGMDDTARQGADVLPSDSGDASNVGQAAGLGGGASMGDVASGGVSNTGQAGDVEGANDGGIDQEISKLEEQKKKLQGAVNQVISIARAYNATKLGDMALRKAHRDRIEKVTSALGLGFIEKDNKIFITDKKGNVIAKRGERVKRAEDEVIFEKARMRGVNADAYTTALFAVLDGQKFTPRVLTDILGVVKDTSEFEVLKKFGFVDEKSKSGSIGELTEALNEAGSNLTEKEVEDAMREALSVASMASSKRGVNAAVKRAIIAREKELESKLGVDEADATKGKVLGLILDGVEKADQDALVGKEREDFVKSYVSKEVRKDDGTLFGDLDVLNYAQAQVEEYLASEANKSNQEAYEDEDIPFSEGGEDAPFQETTDKGAIAINTFVDLYDQGDLVGAVQAAKDIVGNDTDARETYLDFIRANKDLIKSGKPFGKKKVVVSSPKTFREALRDIVPQISDADADALVIIGESLVSYAKKLDPSLSSEYLWGKIQGVMSNDISALVNKYEQIVGENAQLSQDVKDNLGVAREMEVAGKDVNSIRLATGWERGADGKWRYEVQEDNIKIKYKDNKDLYTSLYDMQSEKGKLLTLDEIVSDELKNIYPQLKEVKIHLSKGEEGVLAYYRGGLSKLLNLANIYNYDNVKHGEVGTVIAHEIQHAIQDIEGFSKGSSPQVFSVLRRIEDIDKVSKLIAKSKNYSDLTRLMLNSNVSVFDKGYIDQLRDGEVSFSQLKHILDKINDFDFSKSNYELYRSVSGEVEARNVQIRMGMTPEQRRMTTLAETEDVARSSQIFFQKEGNAKGATSLDQGITAYTASADVSTLIHEPSHNLLGLIDELAKDGNKPAIDAQKTIEAHVKKEGQAFFDRSKQAGESWAKGEYNPNDPTLRQELFARSAEKYFMEGKKAGFSEKMNQIFESFAKMLKEIYRKALNSPEFIELSTEMRSLMDAIYGKEKVDKDFGKKRMTKGLYNTIRKYVENSNYPESIKQALIDNPSSLTPLDKESDRIAMADAIISEYGLELSLEEAMLMDGEIPIQLRPFIFMRALQDLDAKMKTASDTERQAIEDSYVKIHYALGELMTRSGQTGAAMMAVYNSRPEFVIKNIERRINEANKAANQEADEAMADVKKILAKEEPQDEVVSDALDAIANIKKVTQTIATLKRQAKVIQSNIKAASVVRNATLAGQTMSMKKAQIKTRKKELQGLLGKIEQTNMGAPLNKLPLLVEYIALSIADGVTDLTTIIKDVRKNGVKDQDHLIAEAYRDVRNQLIADGIPVELLSDEGIDATLENLRKEDERIQAEIAAKEASEFRDKFSKNMNNPRKVDSLKEWAREIEIRTGDSTYVDLAKKIEENNTSKQSAKEKADKQREYEKMAAEIKKAAETNIRETIRKGLIAAGFEMKDSLGNPTGKVNWKAVTKDSKNTDQTVNKIIEALKDKVSQVELNAIESALREALNKAINERKANEIEAMIRSRQRNAERKARGLFSRQRNIDRLSNALNVASGNINAISDVVADMFGVSKFTPEQAQRLKTLMEERNAADKRGDGNIVAKKEQEIQAIIHYKAYPMISADKLGSDMTSAMLAGLTTLASNAATIFDTAFYSPIFDALYAQVQSLLSKGKTDKQVFKTIGRSFVKAFYTAMDVAWNGSVGSIAAQASITNNKESVPSIDFAERTRDKYGKQSAFTKADQVKQNYIRVFKRLMNFFDEFGTVVTDDLKKYIVLKGEYLGQGMSSKDASKAAFDDIYSKDFDDILAQVKKDYPDMNTFEARRTAYARLESKMDESIVRQGQLEAAINTGKVPDFGAFALLGKMINTALKSATIGLDRLYGKIDNKQAKVLIQAVKTAAKLIEGAVAAFIYPTMRFVELNIKYIPSISVVMYHIMRFMGLGMYASFNNNKDKVFNTHRIFKDFGRTALGALFLYVIFDFDDDEEEREKLRGFGPRDKGTKMNEMEVRSLETYGGVPLKFAGPLTLAMYLEAAGVDAKRYDQKQFDVVELAMAASVGATGERFGSMIKNLTSDDETAREKVYGMLFSNIGYLLNPATRTMNDAAGLVSPKKKMVTFDDYVTKGLGLSYLNTTEATDFMGNSIDVGQMSAYSLDGIRKTMTDFESKDKDVKDWLSLNGATSFQRVYSSDETDGNTLEIGNEEVYQMTKEADVLRGDALRGMYKYRENFENLPKYTSIEQLSSDTKRDKLMKVAKVRSENDPSKSFDNHLTDVLAEYSTEIAVENQVNKINSAAKYVARYNYLERNGLLDNSNYAWADRGTYIKNLALLKAWSR